MPPLPGESLLLNVFADVHYYFGQPSAKPLHHRFDRGSYLYLYYNSVQGRARLELANAAGTPDQDAVNGCAYHTATFANQRLMQSVDVDVSFVTNSHKQPNLFSVVVEDPKSGSASPRPVDLTQWHLPAFNPKNEQKYLYKVNSLDLYLWTERDADLLLDSIRRVIRPQQLLVTEASPPREHDGSMSRVVQQLERIAVGTPSHVRAPSSVSNQSNHGTVNRAAESHAPGPCYTSPASGPTPVVAPYNPAAPSAPEPITHREKTPPPVDAANGTGLSSHVVQDYPSQYSGALPQFAQIQPQQATYPGPPQRTTSLQSLPPPPPPPGQHPHQVQPPTTSFAAPPPSTQPYSPVPQPQYATYSTQQKQEQQQQQQAYYPQSPGYPLSTPLQSPGLPHTPSLPPAYTHTPLQSPSFPPHTPLQSPGIPGFQNYTYAAQPQQQPQPQPQPQHDDYSVHAQVYRPTEAETAAHGKPHKVQQGPQRQGPGPLEQRIGKVEKGVGRFLRKLDQKM